MINLQFKKNYIRPRILEAKDIVKTSNNLFFIYLP